MEFNFDCVQSLGCDENGFAILEGSYKNRIVPGYVLFVQDILNSILIYLIINKTNKLDISVILIFF
jgi:hypothetical protein